MSFNTEFVEFYSLSENGEQIDISFLPIVSVRDYTIKAVEDGNLKTSDEVAIEMKMTIKGQNIEHTISDKIKIE